MLGSRRQMAESNRREGDVWSARTQSTSPGPGWSTPLTMTVPRALLTARAAQPSTSAHLRTAYPGKADCKSRMAAPVGRRWNRLPDRAWLPAIVTPDQVVLDRRGSRRAALQNPPLAGVFEPLLLIRPAHPYAIEKTVPRNWRRR